MNITRSVGHNGKNVAADVGMIQLLLNLSAPPGSVALVVDGKLTPATVEAIKIFQRNTLQLSQPSGFIEIDSPTLKSLLAAPRVRTLTQLPAGKAAPMADDDYDRAAKTLACEVAAVKAVSQVESRGGGFLTSGRPKILFEAHVFSRLTLHKHDAIFTDISSRYWNRALYRGGENEYPRLMKAMLLDRGAALKAASWGRFQILALNYAPAGHATLDSFVGAMFQSEGAHLDAFVEFVKSTHLVEALQKHDWATFARGYNGPAYAERHYDRRIKEEFERFGGGKKK
jgi:hypothetical protein